MAHLYQLELLYFLISQDSPEKQNQGDIPLTLLLACSLSILYLFLYLIYIMYVCMYLSIYPYIHTYMHTNTRRFIIGIGSSDYRGQEVP